MEKLPIGIILKGLICPENRKSIRASGGEVKVETLMGENGKQEKVCVVVRDGVQESFGPRTEVLSVVMC